MPKRIPKPAAQAPRIRPRRAPKPLAKLVVKRDTKADAVDALTRMQATRPLKPPPGRIAERTRTASELALASDRRAGIIGTGFRLGSGGADD